MGVKIELTIRRKGGSVVEFPAQGDAPAASYHFKPATNDPDGPHIATVANEAHVKRLLSIDAYRLVMDTAAPAPTLPQTPGGSGVPPKATEGDQTPPPGGAGGAKDEKPTEVVAAILELSLRDLKAKINTFAEADLRAALAFEQKNPDGRKGFIEAVTAHLGGDGS